MNMVKLIPDWRQAWRWYSVNSALIIVLVTSAQELLPLVTDLVELDPVRTAKAASALAMIAVLGRLMDQAKNANPPA